MTAIASRLTGSSSASISWSADERMLTRHSPSSIALQRLFQRDGRLTLPARCHDRIGIILGNPVRIWQEIPLALRKIGSFDRYPFASLAAACARRRPHCFAPVLHVAPTASPEVNIAVSRAAGRTVVPEWCVEAKIAIFCFSFCPASRWRYASR